ncbi:MAG: hypothetical protein KTR30_34940 [Saprospiraceae bacterium]|nr:hypothetical protein [Saprospiraceae bacterium]
MKNLLLLLSLLLTSSLLLGQETSPDNALSVTQHSLDIKGKTLNYTATTGFMDMRDESGKLRANVFFIAYTKDDVRNIGQRPITYTFNGGPGSSSVWLHMGGLGPKKVRLAPDGNVLPPPYQYDDNPETWLDETDLVFIDPMMTGYTRPAEGVNKKEFLGYEQDIALVGDFIRQYTSRYKRWSSPKFLAGESYGTTRAAGLSGYLQDRHGLYINGLMLISAVLDFSTIRDYHANDLSPLLRFPTFAATSWYHKKADPKYTDLKAFLEEVEEFTLNDYALALLKGDLMTAKERGVIIDKLHAYTGLSKSYLDQTNLRLTVGRYNKELLRSQKETVGRLDSRFKGYDYDEAGERYEFDPSYNGVIYGPFTAVLNDHLRTNLNFKSDLAYEILTGRARPWDYSNVQNRFLNVAETLRNAISKNPYLKVWISNGYYDLATPYFATEYVVNHMFLKGELKNNINMTYYEAGHMVYIHEPALVQMKKDLVEFIKAATPKR